MKKTFVFLVILILSFATFISCNHDNDNEETAQNGSIIGTWTGVSNSVTGTPDSSPIEFTSTGKVNFTYKHFGNNGQDIVESGKWTKNENKLTIKWDEAGTGTSYFTITELTSSSLKWEFTDGGNKITETYKK
ncbi:lipocalin family protein [Epilithonimonas sp.]|uniref:lipocalin family protein n=1 Tax=Epilithonimonas sp. TaxID=2894511 RepID=UPI0028978028|nr:lipocalin family protein [Epilithonimonas sp.]